jgi:hypothetical protein
MFPFSSVCVVAQAMEWEVNIDFADGVAAVNPSLTLQYQLKRLQVRIAFFFSASNPASLSTSSFPYDRIAV